MVSPTFMRFLYAVFSYKHFLTTINYFRQLYTTYDGYILLSATIYYFRRLYITFNGYILLSASPDCDFVRIQGFLAIFRTCGIKASLEFKYQFVSLNPVLLFL